MHQDLLILIQYFKMEDDATIFTNYLAEEQGIRVIQASSETRGCISANILKNNDKVRYI